jgi:hypothetical protein
MSQTPNSLSIRDPLKQDILKVTSLLPISNPKKENFQFFHFTIFALFLKKEIRKKNNLHVQSRKTKKSKLVFCLII